MEQIVLLRIDEEETGAMCAEVLKYEVHEGKKRYRKQSKP